MAQAFIYDAVRTPRGKGRVDGSLYEVKPISMAQTVLEALRERNDLNTELVDDVIFGIVDPLGEQGSVLPKIAASKAGWATRVSGLQLNRFCASGLEAINTAAAKIIAGHADLIVAGGVESMSRVPMGIDGGPWFEDPETAIGTGYVPQGIGADLIATLDDIQREDVDRYAEQSHSRASIAVSEKRFDRSIVPVLDQNGLTILDRDELIRPDTNVARLAALKASFEKMGASGYNAIALKKYPQVTAIRHVHTPGNSSAMSDGASALLIGSEAVGKSLGLTPRARIVSGCVNSSDSTIMLTGPAPTTRRLLERAGLTTSDIDLFECNEAFASVVLRFMRELNLSKDKVNVNGGAIALGHPLGATGGMLVGMLLDELERRDLKRGVVTLCAGGGMGIASLIERV